MNGEVKKIIF